MKIKTIISLSLLFFISITANSKEEDKTEKGKASYYAKKFHNRRTASGIAYNKNRFTCAHRSYPFGTKLLVRNPDNDKTVVVEVNDRGPFKKERLIDLSYIAAKTLDIISSGIATVEIREYKEPKKGKAITLEHLAIKKYQLSVDTQPLAGLSQDPSLINKEQIIRD